MKQISMNLNFSGVILPVVDCEDGFQRVPLKPICEAIGVDWVAQHKKVQAPYFSKIFGINVCPVYWGGQQREMTSARIDRISPFLLTLNPRCIRGQGNIESADFVEAIHAQWVDSLERYHRAIENT